jgi:4-amino-4-deoxy-L-arabinose transferase-like glycosyltransferase
LSVEEFPQKMTSLRTRKRASLQALSFLSLGHENPALIRYAPHIVIVLTVIAFLLRIYRVGFLSLWVDEYVHAVRAEGFIHGKPLFADDNNGILLTVFVALSYLVFGVTEFAARLPSVVFGALLIPLLYFLGKLLFNKEAGLVAALLGTISLYEIFWSRVSRNYASFAFAYLLLAIIFYLAFESGKSQADKGWLTRNSISVRYLALLPFAFLFSLFNHQLTFFFIFSVMAYGSILSIGKIIRKEQDRFTDKYAFILYPTLAAVILFYLPFVSEIVGPILRVLLPEGVVAWIVPRWSVISERLSSPDAFKTFDMYANVLLNDFGRYWFIAVIGFVGSFTFDKKKALFLACLFTVPFLLMSFVFFDPATPRYLLYIYTFFLLYLALGSYIVIRWIARALTSVAQSVRSRALNASITVGMACLLIFAPVDNVSSLLKTRSHGRVVKPELSVWYFSNWKEAASYVAPRSHPSDRVLSTLPVAANFYLKRDDSIWFRQMHFDTKLKKYVPNEPLKKKGESAWNYDEFLETVALAKRGWLIADYYLYNVMTDPRARTYVIENLKFHFDACSDATVQVFGWDHDVQEPKKAFLFEVGKGENASPPISVTLGSFQASAKARLIVDCEAIDTDQEAFVNINGEQSFFLPRCQTTQRETVTLEVDKRWFHPGKNTLQFGYYQKHTTDPRPGYALYNVSVVAE